MGEACPAGVYGMRHTFLESVSWDLNLGEASWDIWTLGRPVQLGSWLKDDVGTVSIGKNCVSLSPRVEKLKVKKKLINVSYLN